MSDPNIETVVSGRVLQTTVVKKYSRLTGLTLRLYDAEWRTVAGASSLTRACKVVHRTTEGVRHCRACILGEQTDDRRSRFAKCASGLLVLVHEFVSVLVHSVILSLAVFVR